MPSYLAITAGQKAAGAPVDETVVGQMIDNPEAVFANDAGGSDIIGLDPIGSVVAAGGETYLTLSGLDPATYPKLIIEAPYLKVGSDDVQLLMQFSQGGTFYTGNNHRGDIKTYSAVDTISSVTFLSFGSSMALTDGTNNIGNAAGEAACVTIELNNFENSNRYGNANWHGTFHDPTTDLNRFIGEAWITDAALLIGTAFDGVRLFLSAGTWAAGSTLYLYGLRT